MEFSNNSGIGVDEGALYVTSLGQLELFDGANITFDGNKGRYVNLVIETVIRIRAKPRAMSGPSRLGHLGRPLCSICELKCMCMVSVSSVLKRIASV